MGVLGQSRDQGAAAVAPAAQPLFDKTGFFQNVGAGFRQAVAGPHSTQVGQAIYEKRAYDQIVSALSAEGEQGHDTIEVIRGDPRLVPRSFRNPYVSPISLTHDPEPFAQYLGGDQAEKQQIWAAVWKVRQRNPKFLSQFPDEGSLSAFADRQRQADLASAQEVTSRAGTLGTVGSFIGGMAGSLASGDPENLVGGGFGSAAGKTVARTVIKRAVEGAGVNAAAALAAVPGQIHDANHLGQPMDTGDIERQVSEAAGIGAVLGSAHIIIPHAAGTAAEAVGTVAGKVAAIPPVRDALIARSIAAGTVQDHTMLSEWQKAHNAGGNIDTSTPEERAAVHVIQRDAINREASPLHPEAAGSNDHRLDALARSLGVNLTVPDMPSPAPRQLPTVRDQSAGATSPRRSAGFAEAINRSEGSTRNPRSTADGFGNFIESTWLSVAPKVTDTKGMSRAQILELRHDKAIAAKATDYYAAQNASYLHARGIEDSPGNLSLAHFLGPEGAKKLLRADPSTPVESLLPAEVVEANHEVLRGKSASEVIAWAHRRVGASVDSPVARADAVPESDPLDEADYSDVPYERATFKPDELQTDAELMQYKSGGDENGVTGKLKDVTEWNPLMSSEVLAWQDLAGRNVVVDGHQRVGLARRLAQEGQNIELPALVVREADGITAAQARTLGALRNINLGTGSLMDNAKVLRDAPDMADMIRGADNRKEIEGLSKLSYEAFGAAINDVVDPRIAAEVGKYAPDPATHMPLIALLARERISNPREAGNIVRQAVADGFGTARENQLSLLGAEPQQSLYVPIARILDAASKRLREEKRTFKVLSDKSARIEAAGNVLDRTANEGKVVGSDEALAILNATAHSAGPVRDALIAAARSELSGSRRADAVGQFLDALAGIDLRSAARGVSEDRLTSEPSGETRSRDAAAASDEILARSNGPGLYDHAVAARAQAEPFSDPVGEAAKAQTMLLEHDLRPDQNIAETDKQKTALKAGAPLQAKVDQEGTMGLSLFDVSDQPTFRLSDEGEARSLKDILDEADADEAAAQALRDCLK
jgi:hypothetical protein